MNMLKPSRYNFYHAEEAVILNTRTGLLIQPDPQTFQALKDSRLPDLHPDRISELEKDGFLVPESLDELQQVLSTRRRRRNVFRILTTTRCNAACGYCYQKGMKLHSMNHSVAVQTAEFIRNMMTSENAPAQIEWFGGEPLMNPKAIDDVCHGLSASGTCFHSAFTTNGVLFSPEIICHAREKWCLNHVQISLDGADKRHETVKRLPAGSFRKTLENIRLLMTAGIPVSIRINHTDTSAEMELLSMIAREFPNVGNLLRVYVVPLYQDQEGKLQQTVKEILKLRLYLVRLGLSTPFRSFIPHPIHARCASAEGGYTIAPDGNLYTCTHCMTQDQCFGTIWDYREQHPTRQLFISRDISEKCRQCLYLPFCLGGCRAGELGLADMEQCNPDVLLVRQLFSGEDDDSALSDQDNSSSV